MPKGYNTRRFCLHIYCKNGVIIGYQETNGNPYSLTVGLFARGPLSAAKAMVSEKGFRLSSPSRVYTNKVLRLIRPGANFIEMFDSAGKTYIVEFD